MKYYLNKKTDMYNPMKDVLLCDMLGWAQYDALTPRFPNELTQRPWVFMLGLPPPRHNYHRIVFRLIGVFSAKIEGFFHTTLLAPLLVPPRVEHFLCIKKPRDKLEVSIKFWQNHNKSL